MKNNRKLSILFCLLFSFMFSTLLLNAQTNDIRGKILDKSGSPLIGANVIVKGTTRGVISDVEGYYVIKADKGQTIIFSYIGYDQQEIVVGNKLSIDVVLSESATLLSETVVVGMGKQRKASVIGAISQVPISDIKAPNRSLTASLSGRIAGSVVVQRSGEPGRDAADFWIRGISTFGGNKSPLILVDGVERDMQDIAVEEVESLSILKDASATAVYGVRAANGVVLVTTRKGIAQKPQIDLKVETGISDLPNMPEFLGGSDYARLVNEASGKVTYSPEFIQKMESGVDPYLYPNVNWFNETFKKFSNNTNASLSIRGGGEVARYFISASFMSDNGNFKENKNTDYSSNASLERYNFRSNVDVTLTKSTVLNIELGANLVDTRSPGIGGSIYGMWYSPAEELFMRAYTSTPLSSPVRVPVGLDANGNEIMAWGAPNQIGEMNPVERLMGSGYKQDYRTQIMTQVVLNQNLSMLTKGLEAKLFFSFDANNGTSVARTKQSRTFAVQGRDANSNELITKEIEKGQDFLNYSTYSWSNRAKEFKAQLMYNRLFDNVHRVGSMFMYYQRDYIDGSAGSSILALPYKKQGIAFRATYSYDDRYFGEFNLGYNGSENFPKESRFGVFPAGAVGYMISNESFWEPLLYAIPTLKFKGSVGLVGAEVLAGGRRFGYLSTYGGGLGGYNFGMSGDVYVPGVGEDQVGVQNLTWEKGLKSNIGAEMTFVNGIVTLSFDLFKEKRTDILIQRTSIPGMAGLNQTPFANMGEMENKGFDGTLEINHSIGDLKYKLYGNYTFTRNKILEQDEANKKYAYRMRTGHSYGQQFGLVALGLFQDQDEIDNSPTQTFGPYRPGDVKYKDVNEDGIVDIEDEVAIGYSSIPEIVYGFGAQFEYKGFDVSAFFRGQANVTYALGGSFIPFAEGTGKGNLFKQAIDRWTPENPNPNALYPRLYDGRSSNNWQASSRNIYDGSFVRLSDIEVGYNFPKKWLQSWGCKGLRVYFLANNVALFAKWKMWDPETGSDDGGKYPIPRKFNFGFKTTF